MTRGMLSYDSLLKPEDRDALIGKFAGGMLNHVQQPYSGDLKTYGMGPGHKWFGPPPGGTTPTTPTTPSGAAGAEVLGMLYPQLFDASGQALGDFGPGRKAATQALGEMATTGALPAHVKPFGDEAERKRMALLRLQQMAARMGGLMGSRQGESNAGPSFDSADAGIGPTAGAGLGGPAGMGF